MRSLVIAMASTAAFSTVAQGASIAASTSRVDVTVAECLETTLQTVGGEARHLEFESRGGEPIYEFVVESGDARFYVGCSGRTGLLQDVDVLVDAQDPRFGGKAKVDEGRAREVALAQYPGEVEEVKRFLSQDGRALYEVDVEVANPATGEFNVWVDAVSGALVRVDVEYWEIGAAAADD